MASCYPFLHVYLFTEGFRAFSHLIFISYKSMIDTHKTALVIYNVICEANL